MADSIGNLSITISGDSKNLLAVMSGVERNVAAQQARMNARGKMGGGGLDLGGMAGGAGRMLMTGAGIAGITLGTRELMRMGSAAIDVARDLELAEVRFKSLVGGSSAGAKSIMNDLREFASRTPFELTEISSAARKLMGGGMAKGDAVSAAKQIAAISAGTGGEISSLARAYGQVSAMGRLATEEFNQFSDADFPVQEFAKTFGTSMGDFRKAMEKGIVPVSVMTNTFKRLTEEGGLFSSSLKDMANTSAGLAKQREAEMQAYRGERGARLESMGASGRQILNWWERVAVDAQVFGAATAGAIGDRFSGRGDGRNLGTLIDERLNPELTQEGIEKQRAAIEEDRLIKEAKRREKLVNTHHEAYMRDTFNPLMERTKEFGMTMLNRWLPDAAGRGNPFREGNQYPEFGGFDRSMQARDFGGAAAEVQGMRDMLARRNQNLLPTAASRGSAQAEEIISRSIAGAMNPIKSVEDTLKEMKKLEVDQKNRLDKVIDELKELNKQKPNIARF